MVATAWVVLEAIRHRHGTIPDTGLMSAAARALMTGHLGSVYVPNTRMTSPPGFMLVAAPFLAFRGGMTPGIDAVIAALAAFLLGASGWRLVRRLRPAGPWWGGPVTFVAGSAGAPTVNGLYGFYHPQDVVATALVLLAVADDRDDHGFRVGVLLGLAVACRQWAAPAVLPILLSPGPRRRTILAGTAVTVAGLLLPFAIAGPIGFLRALRAPEVGVSPISVWNYVGLRYPWAWMVSRGLPVIAGVLITVFLLRRWCGQPPTTYGLLAGVGAIAAVRLLFDSASLGYYALPAFVPLCVIAVAGGRPDERRLAGLAAAVLQLVLFIEPRASGGVELVQVAALLAVTELVALGLLLHVASRRHASDPALGMAELPAPVRALASV